MTRDSRLGLGLEMARCAQANLENLRRSVPGLEMLPMFKVVKLQIEQTIDALEGRDENEPVQLPLPLGETYAPRN